MEANNNEVSAKFVLYSAIFQEVVFTSCECLNIMRRLTVWESSGETEGSAMWQQHMALPSRDHWATLPGFDESCNPRTPGGHHKETGWHLSLRTFIHIMRNLHNYKPPNLIFPWNCCKGLSAGFVPQTLSFVPPPLSAYWHTITHTHLQTACSCPLKVYAEVLC